MVQMTNLSWGMLNLRLVRKISGFFGGGLSISQPGSGMRKKNQQRKLKEQAAGVTEEVEASAPWQRLRRGLLLALAI